MEFVQTIICVGLIYHANEPCPQVHVHLLTNKILRVRIQTCNEKIIDVYELKSEVIWPGKVKVDNNGLIEIRFDKLVKEDWSKPYATRLENMTDIPHKWQVQVVANEPITHDASLISFAPVKRVFNFIHPGHYIQISSDFDGIVRNYSFMAVPMFPMKSLHYPNPGPGHFHSMSTSIRLISRAFPKQSLSHWLTNRQLGSSLDIGEPSGSFCPVHYPEITNVIFYTSSNGIRNAMGLLVWFLQTNRNVTLITFCRAETDLFWHHQMRSLSRITDNRLWYTPILSHASRLWRGKRGRPHIRWVDRYFNRCNISSSSYLVFISGQLTFSNITRWQILSRYSIPPEKVIIIGHQQMYHDYLHSYILTPKVHLQFVRPDMVRVKVNWITHGMKFAGGLVWPGNVSIDASGVVRFVFKKETPKVWDYSYLPMLENSVLSFTIPTRWKVVVTDNRCLSDEASALSVRHLDRVFNTVEGGKWINIEEFIFGAMKLRYYFVIPKLPLVSLTDPNPGPGMVYSTDREITFMVKKIGDNGLNSWLCTKLEGDILTMTNDDGRLDFNMVTNRSIVYLIAGGIGIAPMTSIALRTLQVTKFNVSYIVAKSDPGWIGKVGFVDKHFLKDCGLRTYDVEGDGIYFVLSGAFHFILKTIKVLKREFMYPPAAFHAYLGK